MTLLAGPSDVCAISLSSGPARGSSSLSQLASGPPHGSRKVPRSLQALGPGHSYHLLEKRGEDFSLGSYERQAALALWDRESLIKRLGPENLNP